MLELYTNIKKARLDAGMTQAELAKRAGYTDRSSIAKIEKGMIDIPQSKIEIIAEALGVSARDLMGYDGTTDSPNYYKNISPVEIQSFPMLGSIACGEPVFMVEQRDSYIKAGAKVKADFCLTAHGDSMTGARIYDGDIVFIKKDVDIINGQIYAVAIDDEATLKRVYVDHEAGEIRLVAENPMYKTMVFTEKDAKVIHVLGRAVAFQSDVV